MRASTSYLLSRHVALLFLTSAMLLGCMDRRPACKTCGTIVIGAVGEPATLLPPLVVETVGRDVSDLVFERLAYLEPGGTPIDTAAYRAGLADRWDRLDSLTWRFHLRPGARWHDGKPVTADDVTFSFQAYGDSAITGGAPSPITGIRAVAEDSASVRLTFTAPSPEQLYDATYHVRIIPKHIWGTTAPSVWPADTALAHLVGSGPYRLRRWARGTSLELEADTVTRQGPPALRRVVWRFASDPDAALNLLLAHEVDALETLITAERAHRAAQDTAYRLVPYASAVYGFLAFRVADAAGRPHPVLGDRAVRRALTAAVDRSAAAQATFGSGTRVPPGPMSQGLWIWNETIRTVAFDTAEARRGLAGRRLAPVDILVPSTSSSRRQLAQIVQAAWQRIGIEATITTVDFPVFQERLASGKFDSYIGVYLDEPSPRGLAAQWTRAGWGALNHGRYANPHFDALFAAASATSDPTAAKARWREAMDTLNADAPAIFLFAPTNTAVVHRRLADVTIDPYSWASALPTWTVDSAWARAAAPAEKS